jgi:hypothetical protein
MEITMIDNEELPPVTKVVDDSDDVTGMIERAAAPALEGIGALDLTPSTCRFPLWRGNASVSHRYCGKSIKSATGAYCPEHRPICFNLGAGTRKINARHAAADIAGSNPGVI